MVLFCDFRLGLKEYILWERNKLRKEILVSKMVVGKWFCFFLVFFLFVFIFGNFVICIEKEGNYDSVRLVWCIFFGGGILFNIFIIFLW